jgi:hypothetical protein
MALSQNGRAWWLSSLQRQEGALSGTGALLLPSRDFLLQLRTRYIHIIATREWLRPYVMNSEEGIKLRKVNIGVGAKQREGFEYEFTVSFC